MPPFGVKVKPATGFTPCTSVIVSLAVHPLLVSVTVRMYCPAVLIPFRFCEEEVNPFGPDQVYTAPFVVEPPTRFTEGFAQLKVSPLAAALMDGLTVFTMTLSVVVFTHPLLPTTVAV
jgi:hypothetical protein